MISKKFTYVISDVLLVAVALTLAFLVRFEGALNPHYARVLLFLLPIAIVIKIFVFFVSGLYNQLWRYASLKEGMIVLQGTLLASLLLLGIVFFIPRLEMPRSVLIIDWLLTLGFVGGSRFFIRAKGDLLTSITARGRGVKQKRAIIIGAGQTGSALIKQLQLYPKKGYKPVALLDDDPSKKGLMVHGVKVVGSSSIIPSVIATHSADEVILAMPTASSQEKRRIAVHCTEIGIPCKTVPDVAQMVDGKATLLQIRDLDPKELLGRKETRIDFKDIINFYKGKTILITGAAGSIGSEICRQAIYLEPKMIVGVDISENGLYHLEEEMFQKLNGSGVNFEAKVADVKNSRAIDRLFRAFKPEIIFHAAAYKHVPMMERHPIEAIENNLLGTQVMINASNQYGAERFALVSTDKAVNPTSIMGLSKQLAEHAVKIAAHKTRGTKFMAVRFGNVLGSNGSVIPRFKRLISNGEPITITHPDMTRYFMTISEAVYLVIQATAMGKGGEILILDMGEPVRIMDLAHSMIRLSGLEPNKDIPITITGLRPGEKLYEELFTEDENVNKTKHPKIYKVVGNNFNEVAFERLLGELKGIAMEGDEDKFADYLNRRKTTRAA